MRSGDRRELILTAATFVFGDLGYSGATTDRIAKAAGVSQPYVVRIFGTKEKLFLEVLQHALDTLLGRFREVIAECTDRAALPGELRRAYVDLLTDRGMLLCLMHAFVLGGDPEIGRVARAGFLEVYRVLRDDAGFDPGQAGEFLSGCMLINTLAGLHMTEELDTNPLANELLTTAMPRTKGA
jgi:AcrR family transcriptional regulator